MVTCRAFVLQPSITGSWWEPGIPGRRCVPQELLPEYGLWDTMEELNRAVK